MFTHQHMDTLALESSHSEMPYSSENDPHVVEDDDTEECDKRKTE